MGHYDHFMKAFIMFAFSSLFAAAQLQVAFDADIETQARAGRVAHQLRALAANLDGLDIPESKKLFDAYSIKFNQSDKPKGLSIGRAIAYGAAFAAIREIFGLSELPRAAWAVAHEAAQTKAAATRAARKAASVPNIDVADTAVAPITVADIVAAIGSGIFSEADISAIKAAALMAERYAVVRAAAAAALV